MPDAKRYGREQNGASIGRKGGGALGAGKKVDHRGPTTGEKVRAQGGLQHRNAAQARINPRKFVGKRPGTGFGGHAGHPKRVGYFTRLKLSILNSVVPHESHDTIYEAIQKLTPVVKKTKKSFYSTALTYYQNPLVAGFVADYISAYFGLVRAEQQTRFSDVKGEERRKQIRTEQSSKTFQKQEGGGGEELEPEKERGPGARGGKIDPKTGKYFHDQIHEGEVGGRYYITPEGTYSYVGGGEHPPEPQEQHRALEGKKVHVGPFGSHLAEISEGNFQQIGGTSTYDPSTFHGSTIKHVEATVASNFGRLKDTLSPELQEQAQMSRIKLLMHSARYLSKLAGDERSRISRDRAPFTRADFSVIMLGEALPGLPEDVAERIRVKEEAIVAYEEHADKLYKQVEEEMRAATHMAWSPVVSPLMNASKASSLIKELETAGISLFENDAERKALSDSFNTFLVMQTRVSDVLALKKRVIESGKAPPEVLGKLANAMSLVVEGMPDLSPLVKMHQKARDFQIPYGLESPLRTSLSNVEKNVASLMTTASETVLSFAQSAEGYQIAVDPQEPAGEQMVFDIMAAISALPPMLRVTLPNIRLSAYRDAPYTAFHQNESHIIRMFDQTAKLERVIRERGRDPNDPKIKAWLSMQHMGTLYHEIGHNVLDRYASSFAKLFETYEKFYGIPISAAAGSPDKVFHTKHAVNMFNQTDNVGNGMHEDFAESFKEVLMRKIFSDAYRSERLPKAKRFRDGKLYKFAERLADVFWQPMPKELEGMYDLLTKYDPEADKAFRTTGIEVARAAYGAAGLPSAPEEAPRAPAIGPGEGMPDGQQEPTPEEFVAPRARNEAQRPLAQEG